VENSQANYWLGVDLGKKHDNTVIAVIRTDEDAMRLVGLKIFPLGTEYTAIAGYLHVLTEKLRTIQRILIDQTGVGESFLDEAKKSLPNVEGIVLSQLVKQDVLNYLKLLMQQKRVLIPYQLELANELNIERFELTKGGQVQFSHPSGTHDDRLWALALAVYATRGMAAGTIVPVKRRE
jgi:phage FluMu gp28-like protein